MNDRIRLAETMGWVPIGKQPVAETVAGIAYLPKWQHETFGKLTANNLPDPFTSADDDYAVLEWMRQDFDSYIGEDFSAFQYQVGDYARAALKVLDEEV